MKAHSFLVGVGIFCIVLASFVGTAQAQFTEATTHNSDKYKCGNDQNTDGTCISGTDGKECCTQCSTTCQSCTSRTGTTSCHCGILTH